MNRRRLVVAFLLAAIVCGTPLIGQDTQVSRVLFIGNSYTYVNNLPEMFAQLAKAGGHRVQVAMLAPGGWKLQDHWDRPEDHAMVRDGHWDVVVLQEQSTLGVNAVIDGKPRVTSDKVFRPYADVLVELNSNDAAVLQAAAWKAWQSRR